jgi:hypothetical protein
MVKLNVHIKCKIEMIKWKLKLIYFIKLIKNTYIFQRMRILLVFFNVKIFPKIYKLDL